MISGVIPNINCYSSHKKSDSKTGYNKFDKKINDKTVSLNSLPSLNTPCDAQYLINHNNNNINFKSKYELKTLTPNEFNSIKTAVEDRIKQLGIKFPRHEKERLLNSDSVNCDIVIQSMNILLNHKIIELESVKSLFYRLMSDIERNQTAYSNVKEMLGFVDFITQDENKQVYENETVQDHMGRILLFITDVPGFIECKKKLVKYVLEHNEILSKDLDIGMALEKVEPKNYYDVKSELLDSTLTPEQKEEQKKKARGLYEEIFGPKKRERLGKVIPKKQLGDGRGFERIGGQKTAIKEFEDLVIFPRLYPDLYAGFTTVKGAVLHGPTGTGKSLMARAASEELGWYFVSISANDMKSKFVGGTEENWNNLFQELKENQPAMLFIDEVDAMAKHRSTTDNYTRQELDHFLKLVSDIEAENLDVFILVATNMVQDLDSAFLRDGRFERLITMLPPQTTEEIDEIFNIHAKDKKIDFEDIDKNRNLLYQTMLDLNYTGAKIKYSILKAHTAAIERTGLREKIKERTITKEDINNFSIKTEDFLTVFNADGQDTIANKKQKHLNSIPPKYLTKQSKANTVAVLGSSKTTDDILEYMNMCSNTVKDLVLNGKNIVTGCGNAGIMGSAYNAAKEFSAKDELGRPKQNLAILTTNLFGDEDLENCIPLMAAKNQAERIDKFAEVADTIIVFPGSATTLQETTTLIAKNYYEEDKKKLILVGKDFFKGIEAQYNDLHKNGLIKCEQSELFTIVDSEEEIKKIIC